MSNSPPFLLFYRKKMHMGTWKLAMFHQGLSLASFVCDFLGDLDENETSHYSNFWRSMGESNPLNGSSRVARCRNCRGMQPHVKDTWFPWDSAKMWSCCSSLQMFQRLWSHELEGSLACVPAVNCRNPLERKIRFQSPAHMVNIPKTYMVLYIQTVIVWHVFHQQYESDNPDMKQINWINIDL